MNPLKSLSFNAIEGLTFRALSACFGDLAEVRIRSLNFDDDVRRAPEFYTVAVRATAIASRETGRATDEAFGDRSASDVERKLASRATEMVRNACSVSIHRLSRSQGDVLEVGFDIRCQNSSGESFEELIWRADQSSWCWKIGCSTCGSTDLRAHLAAFASDPTKYSRDPIAAAAEVIDVREPLSEASARRLLEALANVSLPRIRARCGFPMWFGVIGMALWMCESIERLEMIATPHLLQEFRALLPEAGTGRRHIDSIRRDERPLTWMDLGSLESALRE